jgi:hypothetical protein
MKKYLILVFALLLIFVPFNTRADDDDMVLYENEDGYTLDDYYEDDYEDYDDEDNDDYEYYYYDDDSYVMEADDSLDLDSTTTDTCGEKKLFTSNNIIFLAVGVVTGAALTIVAVVCTKGRCTCNCECCSKEETAEKKTKTKKNDK